MLRHDASNCFDFYNQRILDKNICKIFPYDFSIIINRDWLLGSDSEPSFFQFVNKSIFINLFKKSETKGVIYRIKTANHSICKFFLFHKSAFIRFFRLFRGLLRF